MGLCEARFRKLRVGVAKRREPINYLALSAANEFFCAPNHFWRSSKFPASSVYGGSRIHGIAGIEVSIGTEGIAGGSEGDIGRRGIGADFVVTVIRISQG